MTKLKHGMRVGLVAAITLLLVPTASAHAVLVFSNPAPNAHVKKLPLKVEVEFDGNLITLGGSRTNVLVVQNSAGEQIDGGDSKVSGPILRVSLKKGEGSGIFAVSWRVVSSDGHPVEGEYKFSVGNAVISASPKPTNPHQHAKENFFVHHLSHEIFLIVLLLLIGIWSGIERWLRRVE